MIFLKQTTGNFARRIVPVALALAVFIRAAEPVNLDPVQWTLMAEPATVAPGTTTVLKLHAVIDPEYHLYSLTTPNGGPIQTTVALAESAGIERTAAYQPQPRTLHDPSLGVMVEVFTGSVDFLVPVKVKDGLADGPKAIAVEVRYQACSDKICLPPAKREADTGIVIRAGAPIYNFNVPPGYRKVGQPTSSVASLGMEPSLDLHFILLALGFGLAALLTPCVFPLIPLTVSYFLNRTATSRAEGVRQALLFGAGIVLLFAMLGLAVTAAAGPFGVVQLASNAWVNMLIALVFGAVAVSMLGGFEITLPSRLLTSLDGASRRDGLVGSLLMGLTFSLTAFACVGPFLGTLLAASVQTGGWTPVVGMIAFAAGLATPLVVLALFPALLRRLPRSGIWLEQVKIVFGFLILAVMFKYLASADQVLQLHLLTRERFIAIWFALFLMAALYLLGLLRLSGSDREPTVGLPRVFAGVAALAFAISILPGLWGDRLGDIDSFIPPAVEIAAMPGAPETGTAAPAWIQNRYEEALAQARREGKPLLISFSGYACTNCHWAKANLFPLPEVAAALRNYVRVELYTDGTDVVSHRNEQFEEQRFSTVALPFYAVIDPASERAVAQQAGLTRDAAEFARFLTDNRLIVPAPNTASTEANQPATIVAF